MWTDTRKTHSLPIANLTISAVYDRPFKLLCLLTFVYTVLFYSSLTHTRKHTLSFLALIVIEAHSLRVYFAMAMRPNGLFACFYRKKLYTFFPAYSLYSFHTQHSATVLYFYEIRFTVKSEAYVSFLFFWLNIQRTKKVEKKLLWNFPFEIVSTHSLATDLFVESYGLSQKTQLKSDEPFPWTNGPLVINILIILFGMDDPLFVVRAASLLIRWFERHLIGTITNQCLMFVLTPCNLLLFDGHKIFFAINLMKKPHA